MSAGPAEVFGPYFVYEQLGVGGMARVDRAELTGSDGSHRPVALKRMLPHVAENDDMIEAFVREARLVSQLRHANVARTYEFGKVEDAYFIAMELVTGPTLREILKHCARTTGPMPIPIALNILNQVCDALDYAHNLCDETGQPLGIIHRDVSPSNIIVDETGVVKLIDFGVAKASAAGMQTTSGMLKGKFAYMAPEYLVGGIDARADLFAVGVIAHELLTNRPLFAGSDDMETLRRLRTMPIEPPSRRNPDVPPEIDDIVMTALARDPDHRWQHATALRSALTTLTQRLGLICTNQCVVNWVSWAFDQTRPHGADLPAGGTQRTEQSDPSLQIEAQTHSELPSPRRISAQRLVPDPSVPPEPPSRTPLGTPARSITTPPLDDATELHDGDGPLSITDATELHAPDDSGSLGEATVLQTPDEASSLHDATELYLGPRSTPAVPLSAGTRPMIGHLEATLLDGGAALHSRASSSGPGTLRSLGPPPPAASSSPRSSSPSIPPPRATSSPPIPLPRVPSSAPIPLPRAPSSPIPLPQAQLPLQPHVTPQQLPVPPLPALAGRATTGSDAPPADAAPRHRSAVVFTAVVLVSAGLAIAIAYLVT